MHVRRPFPTLGALAALVSLAACGGDSDAASSAPLGLPAMDRPDAFTLAKAELGEKLFFDKRLSANGAMSCETCHLHQHGWTNGQRFSTKVDGSQNTRNSPSLYNVGYQQLFYWDGRAPTLEKNVAAAWKGHMCGSDDAVTEAVGRIAAVKAYADEFEAAFGSEPTTERVAEALAHYVRTLQSGNSAFDRWQEGDENAVSDAAKKGYELFTGKAACSVCHVPPLFADLLFHNVGIGTQADNPDLGRGKVVTDDPKLEGAFKTPTLRSVTKTAPYFHDGSVADLTEAVKLMASGGIANDNLDPLIIDRKLTQGEISQIVQFLKTLESEESFTPPTLPQ